MLHFPQWKVILVFGVVLAGIIFALPNLFPRATMETMPSWIPHHQVNLGLDLQGGAHLPVSYTHLTLPTICSV